MGVEDRGTARPGTGAPGPWPPGPAAPATGALETILRLMRHSRQPMFVAWGPSLSFFYNDAYAPILGGRHPDAYGRPFQHVWPEIWDAILPLIRQALAGQATWSENLHLVMERHGYREDTWWTFSYSPAHDEAGAVAGMFCSCMETTGQVLAERRLRENEGRFRALLDAAPAMMWVTDRTGFCTHLSRSWYDFTGQTPATALGTGWLDAVHPEDRGPARARFLQGVRDRAPFRLDYRLQRADGAWRWTIDAAEPRLVGGGEYLGHVGSVLDITERRETEERQALLAREVDHRAKNVLAVVQAVLRLTRAPDMPSFARAVEGRVAALARAQTLLAKDRWAGADLRSMVAGELAPFLVEHGQRDSRATLRGPAVVLPAATAQPLTMLIHELATNAMKHGALSVESGRLLVAWRVEREALHLDWVETGGPAIIAPPLRTGFGTRVLDGTARGQLGGTIALEWRATGLACRLTMPLDRAPGGEEETVPGLAG
ncbi:sensor histidine kinase [Falsiroseomonas ponticola]|uniref:sensor histidine kinase n=1 Tax=Falsiroseomonas ponticola TaxID=2786951 RepID=UPI0019328F27|nr:PAS domain S-box protein [Roseomonas ponticola]